ncbi:MAG: MFS transporter, partial [Mycobacteriales bacterium]
TGAVTDLLGQRRCYLAGCAALVSALTRLGIATSSLAATIAAPAILGISYNSVIAVQGLWNGQVFTDRPAAGLAAVNTALAVDTIVGPTAAGVIIHRYGYSTAVLAAAMLVALAGSQPPPARRPARHEEGQPPRHFEPSAPVKRAPPATSSRPLG